ncbi:ATP-grasp domain-containing protein [Streptomyces sp. NPDC048332]|uniref:ATP-grasp domain-containing protein n=1 Tax=Streptomyces sp. NPDC048332 TaxID=3154619 RepID=UPI003436CED3
MAHLLMVESWVGSMSRLLPRAIRESGHTFTLLTRDLHHYLRAAPEGIAHPLLSARHVLTADTNDACLLLPFAERAHAALRFDGVISSCDYYLPVAAGIAARLNLPGPAPAAVENACRKDLARRVLAEAGVPGPRFALCRDHAETVRAAREMGLPLVLKPVDLCAGMFVRRVDDEPGLAEAHRALMDFPVNARGQTRAPVALLEEFLHGPEVSVETVTFDGRTEVVGVTDKSTGGAPAFVETGHMFPAALTDEDDRAARETAVRAVEALGLDAVVAHTEIKLTPDGPRVVEVNPRPAGNRITELVRHVTGIDLAAACVNVALGHAPDLRPRATGLHSAAIAFLVPGAGGVLEGVDGVDEVGEAADVLELSVAAPGTRAAVAGSNNAYLGHVMAGDAAGPGARAGAEAHLARLRPRVVNR